MAVPKRGAWRPLSMAQQMTMEKIRRAFDGVISTDPFDFLLDGESNIDDVLQMWDCFAEVYLEISSMKEGSLDLEAKRQVVADLMVWSNLDSHDKKTQQFFLGPHLNDTGFISVGRHLRKVMATHGILDSTDSGAFGCTSWDSESQGSTSEDWTPEDIGAGGCRKRG